MKLLELRAAPFQPNPMANVTVTWRSLTESLLSTAPKYDADGRMIVTFAGTTRVETVASIVLRTVLIIIYIPRQRMLNWISL